MILDLLDLRGFFPSRGHLGHGVRAQAASRGLYRIMRDHGVRPDQVAYIGDSVVDERAAEAAGVRFWGYRDHALNAEVHIDSFWDIKAAMQRCYKGSALTY